MEDVDTPSSDEHPLAIINDGGRSETNSAGRVHVRMPANRSKHGTHGTQGRTSRGLGVDAPSSDARTASRDLRSDWTDAATRAWILVLNDINFAIDQAFKTTQTDWEGWTYGLAGNTLWAATALAAETGGLTLFGVSMLGIAIAALSNLPHPQTNSDDAASLRAKDAFNSTIANLIDTIGDGLRDLGTISSWPPLTRNGMTLRRATYTLISFPLLSLRRIVV